MAELSRQGASHSRAVEDLDGWVEPLRSRITDGTACAACGDEDGAMVPLGPGPRGQLFIHEECLGA